MLKCLFQLCGILTYRISPSQFPRSALVVSVVLKFHCDCSGSTTTRLRGCTLCHMACFHLVPPHVMCWSPIHIMLRINVCVRSVLCTTWSHFSSHKSGLTLCPSWQIVRRYHILCDPAPLLSSALILTKWSLGEHCLSLIWATALDTTHNLVLVKCEAVLNCVCSSSDALYLLAFWSGIYIV